MSNSVVLEMNAVSYAFQVGASNRPVLSNVSIALHSSRTLVVTGPSGCGKTTLLRLMAGLLTPSTGTVRACDDGARASKLGFMFQDHKLIPWITVAENLRFGHASERLDNQQFQEVSSLLALSSRLGAYPAQLSGGQKERIAIGRALLGKPNMLFLDEPLGSTDYVHKLEIEDYIFRRIRAESIAAVVVTHDLDQAIANADQIVVLPSAGSVRTPPTLDVPKDLRIFCPSQARLAPQMAGMMRKLISTYEATL